MKVDLTLENLGELDGGTAGAVINQALRSAIHDTEDRGEDGNLVKQSAEPHPAQHALYDLAALAGLAESHADRAQIWINPDSVVILFGQDLRARGTLPLAYSEPFVLLRGAKDRAFTQRDLIHALRTTLRDCLPSAKEIADMLRKVKFESGQVVDASIDRGKESIGRTLRAEIQATGVLPEYLAFTVPVYANPDLVSVKAVVECALDPDAHAGVFRLTPLPGRVEMAVDVGVRGVREAIEGVPDTIPVYFGRP